MPILNELELLSKNMSPRFLSNIKIALRDALEERSHRSVKELKSVLSDFIDAVRILGLEELEVHLDDISQILDRPGDIGEILGEFEGEFDKLAEILPQAPPEIVEPESDFDLSVDEAFDQEIPDEEIDQSVIDRFIMIPGVGEERARALYRGGFRTLGDLAEASVPQIFRAEGISLKLAKDIADYLNPERFIDVKIIPISRKLMQAESELSFVGKPAPASVPDDVTVEEVASNDDPDLLELFIDRLKSYIDDASKIVEGLSSETPKYDELGDLYSDSTSLISATRYMGFKTIESELSQISDKALKIIDKKEALSDETVSSFLSTIEKLKGGYEGLSDGLSKLSRKKGVSSEDMEYNILTLAQYWMDLNKLYKETDEVIRIVAKKGDITDEDRDKLKAKTSRLDEMAGFISSLLEDLD